MTSADAQERAQVEMLAKAVQQAIGQSVALAYADQGYTGQNAADAPAAQGIQLEVVKLNTAQRGFVLLLRRWVVECSVLIRLVEKVALRLAQRFIAGFEW